jgi:hypothetical protein
MISLFPLLLQVEEVPFSYRLIPEERMTRLPLCAGFLILACCANEVTFSQKSGRGDVRQWADTFPVETSRFSTTGENRYFILKPGYRLLFEGREGRDTTLLAITVLDETMRIGEIETRVVEEKETVNGRVAEVSRNFFAICTENNSVFYFGEDVDIFAKGQPVKHEGSWRAGRGDARAGVMMPGIILPGSRYHQEVAPGVAMDRAEIMSTVETVRTPAGVFSDCLKTEESTPLEPSAREYKYYAPGIGLVTDGSLVLTRYGFQ